MFSLPQLPYPANALEPYIDEATMQIHHGKHHAAYVDNLNKALAGQDKLLAMQVEQLLANLDQVPDSSRQAVINHGGGHANHSFFWQIMGPPKPSQPVGKLAAALDATFGSFAKFQEAFTAKAMAVFGSGWAFLVQKPDGALALKRHSFQNSPLMHGNHPVLGVDVWEHAYYLKYQNRRPEYIEGWWHVVNWTEVSARFARAPGA